MASKRTRKTAVTIEPELVPAPKAAAAKKPAEVTIDGDETDAETEDDVSTGMILRRSVALPDGEWVRDEQTARVNDETLKKTIRTTGRTDNLYASFVRHATGVPRLTDVEERALGLLVRDQQDKKSAQKLVLHNLRLAIKMAHQYRRAWTNVMDLIQEASAGMAIAAQRWDPDQGTRFGTYAVYWIRAQLTRFLMTNGRSIHTGNTRAGRKLYFQLPRIRRKLLAEGKTPSIQNIALEVQESEQEVARVVARLDNADASFDAPIGSDDDGSSLGDSISGGESSPEENAAQREVSLLLSGMVKKFGDSLDDERDRAIWKDHLLSGEPASLVELGERFGVTKQRMGQLATRLKRGFRRFIIDELGPTTQLHWLFRED
jgi:RNA polymerase sigma-32 factor